MNKKFLSLVEIRKLLRLVIVLAVMLLLCLSFYLREAGLIEKSMLAQERARVEALSQLFRYEIRPIADDLRQFAQGDELHSYIANGESSDLDGAIQQAAFFSRLNSTYDQIRYLNVQGTEVLRVNQNGKVVPPRDLQDKSSRPYFQEASQLAPGQIYLSALDLNRDNGQVEEPLKPVFRFSTPLFDQAGQRHGVYVINVLSSKLFTDLQELRPDLKHRLRLFNDEGYWLKAAHPEKEWGFMFPDRQYMTLAHTAPDLWARLVSQPRGQSRHGGGVLTWQRIDLRQLVADDANSVVTQDEYLVLASETSAEEFQALFTKLRTVFSILTVVVLALAFIGERFNNSRRLSREALRRSEEDLAVTLRSIGDAVLATDSERRITRMNPAAEKLTGWTQREAQGRPVDEVFRIINEETRQAADIPVDLVLATGRMQSLANHTMLIARDGTELPIADSAAPILDNCDRMLGVVLVFRDVTSERCDQERFKTVVEASPSAMIMFDLSRRITLVNSQTERIFGYARDELLGQPIELLTPVRFQQEYVDSIFTSPRAMGAGPELYGLRKDGSEVAVEIGLSPVTTVEGVFVLASVIDISERKRTQDTLRKSEEEAKRLNTQLEIANKELEAFSYSVSHDLRAPLRHIHGYVEMLVKDIGGQLTENSQRYLTTVSDCAVEMGQLIDNLLEFSRMGRSELKNQKVCLDDLLKTLIDGLKSSTVDRKIAWKVSPLPDVVGDQAMLKQVFVNLLSNAIKYTRPRTLAEIEIGCQGQENDRVVLFVRDNGVGFDMKYVGKLFGVFQRLHRVDEFEGTGIGLANVRRIINRHDGRVWVESKLNVGTTFYFTLKPVSAE